MVRCPHIPLRLATAALLIGAAVLASVAAPADASAPPTTERMEIVLDPRALPAADRERFDDRAQSIADAVASGLPLWRSFEPREVLAQTLSQLADAGVDVGGAIVNFDSLEADASAGTRERLAKLGFVRGVYDPAIATPSGSLDSEGLESIGSDLANLAGITGAGIKVAVIDSEWDVLAETIAEGDLPAIPLSMQFQVNATGTTIAANSPANGAGDREHGTAAAEVVHEVAPGATLLLYKTLFNGQSLLTPAAIKAAIRHAADQGAKVILVPVHIIRTMSDPRGPAQGGANQFTDDIAYAKAAGSVVVVPAGNEALRHYSAQFTPCEDCTTETLCNTATNDTSYHVFDDDLPLNDLILDTDYDDFAYNDGESFNQVQVTCFSATDAVNPNDFRVQLLRFRDNYLAPEPPDFPSCPSDEGTQLVTGTEQPLGGSFSKELSIYNLNFDDYYFLAVKRIGGTETPNFRLNCTIAVGELTYVNEVSSLSDLAVVDDSLAVGGTVLPDFEGISDVSSKGPTANESGPMKPDLVAPSEITNFAALERGFTFWETFNGTSAAASHVAGVVALLQSDRAARGLPLYSVDEVKQVLFGSAIELDDGDPELAGPDPIYGHGLVQIPAAILPGVPGMSTRDDRDGDGKADPAHYDTATGDWKWLTSTAGETTLAGFGGGALRAVSGDFDGDGRVDAATYDEATGNWTFTTTTTPIAPLSGLGGPGFLPATGDYDGDGKTDPGVYDATNGTWRWQGSTEGAGEVLSFGGTGFIGVPADFDGDGKTDVATFEDATGKWSYIGTTEGPQEFTFSPGARWIPVPTDFDGDGKADAATFQKKKGKWRFRLSSLGGLTQSITGLGGAGWIPVPADYDGDGKADPGAYRKANGLWRWVGSEDGATVNVPGFGGPGFTPVVFQRPS